MSGDVSDNGSQHVHAVYSARQSRGAPLARTKSLKSRLLPFVVAVYAVCSLVFGLLLYFTDGGEGIGGDIPPDMHAFEVCWWFSTVNLVTAGFGAMVPAGRYAYIVSTVAHLLGLLLNSLLLGIVVAKASVPTAKMIFSNVLCVRTRNNIQHLMVRVGNGRGNMLYSPDIRLAYVRAVITEEGEKFFQDTQLQVKVPVSLQPIFMITHAVTKDSPLYGKTERDVNMVQAPVFLRKAFLYKQNESGFFVLIVSAAEVETGQALYSKKMYFMKDVRFNHSFVDVVSIIDADQRSFLHGSAEAVEHGLRQRRMIEFRKFHDTQPLESSQKQLKDKSNLFGALEDPDEGDEGLDDLDSEPHNSPRAVPAINTETLKSASPAKQDRPYLHPPHQIPGNGSSIGESVREAAAVLISPKEISQVKNPFNGHKAPATSASLFPGNPLVGSQGLTDQAHAPKPIGQLGTLGLSSNAGARVAARPAALNSVELISAIPEGVPLLRGYMERTSSEPHLSIPSDEGFNPGHSTEQSPKRWSLDEHKGKEQSLSNWLYSAGLHQRTPSGEVSKEPSFDAWSNPQSRQVMPE